MSDEIYKKLAKVLDTLPNGFPATESGVEIRLLERIFDPDQAVLFCNLRLAFESAEQIAERTGRPLEGLEEALIEIYKKLRPGEPTLPLMPPASPPRPPKLQLKLTPIICRTVAVLTLMRHTLGPPAPPPPGPPSCVRPWEKRTWWPRCRPRVPCSVVRATAG